MAGCLSAIAVSSVSVQEKPHRQDVETKYETHSQIPHLREIQLPATSAQILGQQPAPTSQPATPGEVIAITGVQANPTDNGVEVILQTPSGEQLQIINRSAGNSYIADIPNAQLRLPSGDAIAFGSENPIAGITEITVTNLDASTIRVTVTGEAALPTVELFDSDEGLIFDLTPATSAMQPQAPAADDETIEIVVTGEQEGYNVPNTSVGTRTDTPLRDIPQSIQVVPQQVLRDQNVTNLNDALTNVPGVAPLSTSRSVDLPRFVIRGFINFNLSGSNILRNGLREAFVEPEVLPNIERVEVLKGPASVLYGTGNLGGTINIVTEQPLRDPFYEVEASIGSYDYYRGAIDLSGPLNDSKTLLYRLNVGYLNAGSFVDFYETESLALAPVIRWDIGERTRITLEGEYTDRNQVAGSELPPQGTVLPNRNGKIPRNRFTGNPDSNRNQTQYRLGYRLEHEFSDNWSIQQEFQWRNRRFANNDRYLIPQILADDQRTLEGIFTGSSRDVNTYNLNVNLTGRFATGSIGHQLVLGVDLNRYDDLDTYPTAPAAPLDLFNPVYRQPPTGPFQLEFFGSTVTDTLGIYLQDLVTLTPNLKLLLGGRFDLFERRFKDLLAETETRQSGDSFSPRVGIVYQPIEPISLYASYSRSFVPNTGRSFERELFEPELGTQYEVGVKADVNDRLAVTLALYDLTRSGVLTEDRRPGIPPGEFQVQTGEQRSRGVELSLAGEILPGWNIFAGYAYTDARLTEDNVLPVGDRLELAPEHSVNLWTTYQIQSGDLQGLGVGLGLFFVGDQERELPNTYQLPSYLRTDASIFYNRDRFRAALNFKNLFDVEYFEPGGLGVAYGDPFTVQGTISWQF